MAMIMNAERLWVKRHGRRRAAAKGAVISVDEGSPPRASALPLSATMRAS